MRKIIFTFLFVYVSFMSSAQITSTNVLSEKLYEDNTKTVYLEFEGQIPANMKSIIETDMGQLSGISVFSFYDSGDMSRCMITCQTDFNLRNVENKINNLISRVYDTENVADLAGTFYENGFKTAKFKVDISYDDANVGLLREKLQNLDKFSSLDVNNDGVFKITLSKNTPWYEVDRVFKENGVKEIIPIF